MAWSFSKCRNFTFGKLTTTIKLIVTEVKYLPILISSYIENKVQSEYLRGLVIRTMVVLLRFKLAYVLILNKYTIGLSKNSIFVPFS